VTIAPGGFPQFSSRTPRWRDKWAAQAGLVGRDNALVNLTHSKGSRVEAWCRDEDEARLIEADALLAAFEAGRSTIHV
jgi:hypothetical protein